MKGRPPPPQKQNPTTVYTIYFHLHKILGNANLHIKTESISVVAWTYGVGYADAQGHGEITKGYKETFGDDG